MSALTQPRLLDAVAAATVCIVLFWLVVGLATGLSITNLPYMRTFSRRKTFWIGVAVAAFGAIVTIVAALFIYHSAWVDFRRGS